MPTPREIKRRIGSIRNTQKITKAMEMVSSVKLRKARSMILNARPYAQKLSEIAGHLQGSFAAGLSPLLTQRKITKTGLVLVSSDKGLCGGFNANVAKKGLEFLRQNTETPVMLTLVGKKVSETFKRMTYTISDSYTDVFFKPEYASATRIGQKLLSDFLSHKIDEVVIIYNEFKSTVSQKIKVERLLPVPMPETQKTGNSMKSS
jgi:F-type H+-transporting ATPase subunit gamma